AGRARGPASRRSCQEWRSNRRGEPGRPTQEAGLGVRPRLRGLLHPAGRGAGGVECLPARALTLARRVLRGPVAVELARVAWLPPLPGVLEPSSRRTTVAPGGDGKQKAP